MDIVVKDSKGRDIELDKHYKVNDSTHPLHGKTVKVIDWIDGARGQFFIAQKYDGTKVTLREEQIAPLDSRIISTEEWPGRELKTAAAKFQKTIENKHGPDENLMDACGSSSKEDRDNLHAALNNRVHTYKGESARAVRQLEIGERISQLIDKHSRQKEELEAWRNGTWWDEYYEPCPKKIGVTAGVQLGNIVQLICLCSAGGFMPLIGVGVFGAVLYGNYRLLKTWNGDEG